MGEAGGDWSVVLLLLRNRSWWLWYWAADGRWGKRYGSENDGGGCGDGNGERKKSRKRRVLMVKMMYTVDD